MTILRRFLTKIKIDHETGCWNWTGCTDGRYGIIHFPGFYKGYRMAKCHHVSLYLFRGIEVERGKSVMHSCDNTVCCNPDHLSVGTHTDNMRDMVEKGRNVPPNQKLTTSQIQEARRLRGEGFSVKTIAEMFCISPSQMSRVTSGMWPKYKKGKTVCKKTNNYL